MRANLVRVASDRWNELDRMPPSELHMPRRFFERVLTVSRLAITALLAPGLVWGLQKSEFALKGATAEYATIAVGLWFVVTMFLITDPLFTAKISAIRDLAQVLPWPGKKPTQ